MRRVLIGAAAAFLAVFLAVLLAAGGSWWWAGRDDSLGHAIAWAQRWLPEGDTLEVQGVQGALRRGGRIDLLRWKHDGLEVEVRQLEVQWQPRPLLSRRVKVDLLRAAQVTVRDGRPAAPSQAATPPASITLPVQVDTPLEVAALRYEGSVNAEAGELSAHYVYDGEHHRMKLNRVVFAQGRYRGDATLQATAPLALSIRLDGDLKAPLPGREPLQLQAHAEATGTLAGADAAMDVKAHVVPQSGKGMQADLAARLQPWQAQPVASAQASWQALDLSVLWPRAPRTQLQGDAQVHPLDAQKWQLLAQTTNRASGPWDQQRLPLATLQLRGSTDGNAWDIAALDASIAGGQLHATGRWARTAGPLAPAGWQGEATLQHLNPAALHTQLAEAALDGTVTARALPPARAGANAVIGFKAQLQPSARQPATSRLNGLQLTQAQADGQWDGDTLTLKALRVQTRDALLQGSGAVRTATLAMRGELHVTAPGAQFDVQGAMAPQAGEGSATLRVSDAARALPWVAGLPGLASALGKAQAAGNADLRVNWQGGWQQEASALRIDAQAVAPRLDYRAADTAPDSGPDSTVRLREVRIDVAGVPASLALSMAGRVERGTQRLQLKLQADGGRAGTGHWTARIASASAALQSTAAAQAQVQVQVQVQAQSGWRAQLRTPVGLDWQIQPGNRQLTLDAGELLVQAPGTDAATASVLWQPVRWSHNGVRASFSSRGQVRGLPQAWLEQLGETQLTALGLAGDLLFDGEWDVESAAALRLNASLSRRSGDIQLQAGDGTDRIRAGVRDARVTLATEGTDGAGGTGGTVRATLRWDSAAAGQVDASVTTRIAQGAGGFVWAGDAPLGGTVRARLPQVGIWSALAPPGWRLRGTLDAQVALSGTRDTPQWHGTLAADELALRSVVDGIEFSRGRLRATLDGQRLAIDTFTLQGASNGANPSTGMGSSTGSSVNTGGGTLSVTGNVQWLPPNDKSGDKPAGMATRVRMSLQATAQALRVSARADRRLVVSGDLQAQLAQARLQVRGKLRADQALFILPDDTTPGLSDDVIIRKAGSPAAGTPAREALPPEPAPAGQRVVPDVDLALDLGPDFRLQGRGIVTRLAGTLTLRSTPVGDLAGTPRLTGDIRTVAGSYKAYGQNLDIEEGLLRFTGPYDNPTLNILAIRPNLSQRVGVQITGTALLPRVRLYADPDLPDAEKLAWLVLGRGAANGGAEAAVLQQAALALLGGNGKGLSGGLAESLGLDELSFRGNASNVDGTTTSAAVTLGKRLSRNFYVAYERSLAGTLGTFYIFYDLSRRFTVRAQAGEQSAVDLIFTITYD